MPRPAQTPLAGTIHKIQYQCNDGAENKYASKKYECCQHFLDKVDLQSEKRRKPDPQPLSGFLLADRLSNFQLSESFPRIPNWMQFIAQMTHLQFKS